MSEPQPVPEAHQRLSRRMWRAARLDEELFDEVRDDPQAIRQAMATVVLAALGAGIGHYGAVGLVGIFGGLIAGLLGWYVWAYLAYLIGVGFYPGEIEDPALGDMLRTMGFASAPGVLRIFAAVPGWALIVEVGIGAWMVVAAVIAVQRTFGYPEVRRAAGVALMAWSAHYLMLSFLHRWFFAA